MSRRCAVATLAIVTACSSKGAGGAVDAAAEASRSTDASVDAPHDARHEPEHDAARDAGIDAVLDAGIDAPAADVSTATTALVRLANWSPDAPGLDFCVAPEGTSLWSAPVLAAQLGHRELGKLSVDNAGLDAGRPVMPKPDAGNDAHAPEDARADARDAGEVDEGVLFLRLSPYVALTPGAYDLSLVAAGSPDCTKPLFEIDDLPALTAGSVQTLAAVGDTVDEGADPALSVSLLPDDTTVAAGSAALRFINAVPSVIEVTFASGTVAMATAMPYLSAAQFGAAAVDTDAGALDTNDYLTIPPVASQVWSLINANGGTTTLVAVEGAGLPAGHLATVVGVGGESGPDQKDIGILVCTDQPPIVAGETARCVLFEEAMLPVCDGC
jgi:hypothetical protein